MVDPPELLLKTQFAIVPEMSTAGMPPEAAAGAVVMTDPLPPLPVV